jgi:hypothetical protein
MPIPGTPTKAQSDLVCPGAPTKSKVVKITIQLIFTFRNRGQEFSEIIVPNDITEEILLRKIFAGMEAFEVEDVIKVSTAQYGPPSRAIKFLIERDGKYYFNPEDNPKDADVEKWTAWKRAFVDELRARTE